MVVVVWWLAVAQLVQSHMGVVLTPIIENQPIALDALRGKMLAVDGNGELYQFLALIRLRDGTPLRDAHGRITSHLSGLFFRTTRLIAEHGLRLVFVFDGAPPPRKAATLEKRRDVKRQFERDDDVAADAGDGRRSSRAAPTAWPPNRPGAGRRRSAGCAHGAEA